MLVESQSKYRGYFLAFGKDWAPRVAVFWVLTFNRGLLHGARMCVGPSPSSLVVAREVPVSTVDEGADWANSLYGDRGTVTLLKRCGYLRIGVIFLAGLASGAAAWMFLGMPVGMAVCLVVSLVPHFTPWGVLGVFWSADRTINAKMREVCGRSADVGDCNFFENSHYPAADAAPLSSNTSAMDKVMILHRACFGEICGETDSKSKVAMAALYKGVLDIFNGTRDGKTVLVRATQAIDDANLSPERKALFIQAVKDCVENEPAPEAVPNTEAGEPGMFMRAVRWCSSFLHGRYF
jgi:hypothetical protein